MSEKNENVRPTDNPPDEGEQALSVLRGIWGARAQTIADIDEACGNTKSCKNMVNVGFQWLVEDAGAPADSPVGNDLRAAWKMKLAREGKLNPEAQSVRDLALGSSEPK